MSVYNSREGVLSWVSASGGPGNANAWATAPNPASGIAIAFVRNFNFASGQTVNAIPNRGTPNHLKLVDRQPITVNVDYAFTGGVGLPTYPVHLEFHVNNAENGSAFWQVHYAHRVTHTVSEGAEEGSMSDSFIALGYNAATASGYLATS